MKEPRELLASIVVCLLCWTPPVSAQTPSLPLFGHIVIVVDENANYTSVVGNSSMPYLNSLISTYGLAVNYIADTHPSIGNYFVLTTGQILTNDDGQTPSSFPVSVDNIAHELEAAGKTWKDYHELAGTYYVRHDPLAYMTNINSANIVDFSQFASDLANANLPNLSWLAPNGCDDAHDCPLSTADSWLQTNLDPLIKSALFQKDGLLIITFDEDGSGSGVGCTTAQIESGTWCGGHVATVLVSPKLVSAGFESSNSYHHENVLKLMMQGLGLTTYPGASANAANMADFFAAAPAVTLSPQALSFSNQPVGTTSSPQTVTLQNTSTSSANISSITIGGTGASSFAQTNNCMSSLSAGASCAIDVTFTAGAAGMVTATLTVTDNASNSPQTVGLTGAAATPVAGVSPPSLTFGNQNAGTTSGSQPVTLSNTGNAPLTITSLAISANFGETNNCGGTVAAGGSCTINVSFSPASTGPLTGALSITDNNQGTAGSTQSVALSGTGQDFTLAAAPGSPTSAMVAPGSPASYTLSVGGEGGFNQSVTFTCTGAPSEAMCTPSPSPVTPGSSATNVTVTVTTTAPSVGAPRSRPLPPALPLLPSLQGMLMLALVLAATAWTASRRNQPALSRWQSGMALFASGLLLALALTGCGGGGGGGTPPNPGTPAGTYTLTVTGSAGSGSSALSHKVTLTLTVS